MESKGNRYLIEAASILARKRNDVRTVVVGEGPLLSALEAQARELGVSERVTFLGFQRDVAQAFAAFDVAVFPSLWEGTPLTVFEAMAMNKPLVATSVDGLLDVLCDDDNALLVPPKDAGALASALERSLDDPQLATRLSERALQTSRRFDIRMFVHKMERLYELIVDRYRASGRRPRWDYAKDFAFLEEVEESGLSSLREARAVSS
jgi:glycosyltransferase involved in cell wall biosynthesis